MFKNKAIKSLMTVTTALALGTMSTSALAAQAQGGVSVIEYGVGGFGSTLLIQLPGGANYYAVTSAGTGCTSSNQTMDTIKAWTSMTQSALLAGKQVRVYFSTCNGTNFVVGIDLLA